jgi:hypothetical protein
LLEREPPPLPGIVPPFDVVKDIRSRIRSRSVLTTIYALTFEQPKETFCGGVIGATAHRTHTTGNVVSFEKSLVLL